jgi:hypothetical protein
MMRKVRLRRFRTIRSKESQLPPLIRKSERLGEKFLRQKCKVNKSKQRSEVSLCDVEFAGQSSAAIANLS